MINWWLDKGIAGFRIDAIINIKKLLPFKDFPADREDGLCSIHHMLAEAKNIGVFLNEMSNETFRKYDAFTVGEVFNEKEAEIPLYIGDNGYFSSMFDFAETIINQNPNGWYGTKPVTAEQYKKACFESQKKVSGIGFLSNIIENHDEPRGVSHYLPEGETSEAAKKMLGGLNFMLQGLPFLYQGQELGMENTVFESISQIDDIATKNEYKNMLDAGISKQEALDAAAKFSRDNARTPFQWDNSPNAGFTTGTPWLKVNPNYTSINLAEQRKRPDSVWNFYRRLIKLRKNPEYAETVLYGETVPYLKEQENLMAYYRKGEKVLLVAGNFQKEPQSMQLPAPSVALLLNNMDAFQQNDDFILLEGYQFLILELNSIENK